VLLDRVLAGVLRRNGRETWLNPAQQQVASELYKKFFEKFQGAEQDQVLDWCDAHARMRRLFHITYALDDGSPFAEPELQAVRTCNRWIQCVEVILFAMESLVDHLHVHWYVEGTSEELVLCPLDDIWRDIHAALRFPAGRRRGPHPPPRGPSG
jgi:hypothetical protein